MNIPTSEGSGKTSRVSDSLSLAMNRDKLGKTELGTAEVMEVKEKGGIRSEEVGMKEKFGDKSPKRGTSKKDESL